MGVNSVIFANTKAYSAFNSMLTAERYQRLLDCANGAELKKCLTEFGYEGETTDEMFSRALDGIYAYLNEGSPLEPVRLALVKKNDYHNAKVMAKCKYVRREITDDLLYPHGAIDTGKMKEFVLNDEYALLPPPMSAALGEIDLRFSQGERNGRLIDCLLNKAMYADIFQTLGGYNEMKEVFSAEVDFSNISAVLRVRKNGMPLSAFTDEFIEGGTLSLAQVSALYDCSQERARELFLFNDYRDFLLSALDELLGDALVDYERACDDYIITKKLRPYRGENAHYMLFYGYVLARLYELKNVRIICGGVRAGTPKEQIRAKLRVSYVG